MPHVSILLWQEMVTFPTCSPLANPNLPWTVCKWLQSASHHSWTCWITSPSGQIGNFQMAICQAASQLPADCHQMFTKWFMRCTSFTKSHIKLIISLSMYLLHWFEPHSYDNIHEFTSFNRSKDVIVMILIGLSSTWWYTIYTLGAIEKSLTLYIRAL